MHVFVCVRVSDVRRTFGGAFSRFGAQYKVGEKEGERVRVRERERERHNAQARRLEPC